MGKKGPVFTTAIIAGVQAAKRTSDLVPFCHPLPIEDCRVELNLAEGGKVLHKSLERGWVSAGKVVCVLLGVQCLFFLPAPRALQQGRLRSIGGCRHKLNDECARA